MYKIRPIVMGVILLLSFILNSPAVTAGENPPPGPPRDLVFSNLTDKSLRLRWGPPEDGVAKKYNVYKNDVYFYSLTGLIYDITGLSPATTYTFKVSAINDAGEEGPFSNGIIVTTESPGAKRGNAVAEVTYPKEGQRLNALEQVTGTATDSDGTVCKVALLIADSQGRYLKPDLSSFKMSEQPDDYYIFVYNTGTNYSTWALDLENLAAFPDGEYTISVCANDGAYNIAQPGTSFILDTTRPENPPPKPPSKSRRSSRRDEEKRPVEYTLLEYPNHQTDSPMLAATIQIGQASGVINRSQDGYISVDTTNYFPGKQISCETFIIEEQLILEAIGQGVDITVTGGLGSLHLKTSLCPEYICREPVEVSIQRGSSHQDLSDFLASHPGFEPISDVFVYDFSHSSDQIPLFACVPLPEHGLEEDCRVGYIFPDLNNCTICRYNGVWFTTSNIMFPIHRPGAYSAVLYKNPYSGYDGHWAEEELDRVLAAGIYVPEGFIVMPDSPITCCQFKDMLDKSIGANTSTDHQCHGPLLTRGDMAQMVAEALGITANFNTDIAKGLLIGFEDGNVYPGRDATLAQAATVLCRMMVSGGWGW